MTDPNGASGDSGSSIWSRARAKLEASAPVVLAAVFLAGMGLMEQIHSWAAPHEKQQTQQKPAAHPRLPLRVGFIGPMTGDDYKAFGLSQLRGAIAAILQGLKEQCDVDDWRPLIKPTIYDETPLMDDHEKMRQTFTEALKDNDLVLGPVFSSDAIPALDSRSLDKPVLLVNAASMRIREHPDYGVKLFQLASNTGSYVDQLLKYFLDFSATPVKNIVSIYQDDEFGKSSHRNLAIDAASRTIDVVSVPIPPDHNPNDATLVGKVDAVVSQVNPKLLEQETTLVVVTALGRSLSQSITDIMTTKAKARIATITSLEQENIKSGQYNGLYVMYSFQPRVYSVGTLEFYRYIAQAQSVVDDLLPVGSSKDWHRASTMDAEAHDAALYWFDTRLAQELGVKCSPPTLRRYATDFAAAGIGKSFKAEASLLLFQISNGGLQTVALDR